MRSVRVAAGLAAVVTYALIVLGALVRSTNSGLACPDWPTCYGQWVLTPADFAAIPETGYTYGQVMLEWGHRLVAGFVLGPLVLVVAVLAVIHRRQDRALAGGAAVLVLLMLVQGALGGLTVLDRNSPWSVALHLGNALLVLTTILFIRSRSSDARPQSAPWVGGLAAVALATTLGAMLSAAMTAKSGASLACATWPLCDGALIPDLSDPLVRIHFLHRSLALVAGVLILITALTASRTPYAGRAFLALLLVVTQIGLGALVIVLRVPTWNAVLHQAVGVLVFAVLASLMWRAFRSAPPRLAPTIGETRGRLALRGA